MKALLALAVLLLAAPATAAAPASFESSHHTGPTHGTGTLAGLEYVDLTGARATLAWDGGLLERGWANQSVQAPAVTWAPTSGMSATPLEAGSARLFATGEEALLMVFPTGGIHWEMEAQEGVLSSPAATVDRVEDRNRVQRLGGTLSFPVDGSAVWSSAHVMQEVVRGDFRVSLYEWGITFDDGSSFTTGATTTTDAGAVRVESLASAWLHLDNATLTVESFGGMVRRSYVSSPTLVTDGTVRLEGLVGDGERLHDGTTTVHVTSADGRIRATLDEGSQEAAAPATTALAVPADSPWLWGGLGAVAFVAAFVFVALAARSVPMLEWRSYHALDRHRPHVAAFWANLWTRRDPWDGHAWSARGEARMMVGHDRGAARDFTKAHPLLPPEERAVNALHAARSHARLGHATQTAHWIGIVANLDINVLLTAREEPDFARVWDHAAVQHTVRQVLGVGA